MLPTPDKGIAGLVPKAVGVHLRAGVVSTSSRIILGIDPGTTVMGYGLIEVTGQRIKLLTLGAIPMQHFDSQALKLKHIHEETTKILELWCPDEVALEAPFLAKNVQIMLKLGRAQGVAMAAALLRQIPICEYAPRKIKQSITGNGNATKEQVAAMLAHLLPGMEPQRYLDATDGLAVAVCHHMQGSADHLRGGSPSPTGKSTSLGAGKTAKGWGAFVAANPGRISK